VCVRNLKQAANTAHAPYCHLWPVGLYNTFKHLKQGTTFGGGKKYWT